MKRIFLMAFLAAGLYASALTVTVEQGSTQTDPINTLPIVFDVVFSDSVSDFAIEDVTWNGTATGITANVAGSGTTYTINVTVSGDGTLIPSLAADVAHDGSSNPNTASTSTDNSVTYDSTDPTVTINQNGSQPDPTKDLPLTFDIVFNEAVTGFAIGDVTFGGTATGVSGEISGSGTTYSLSVTTITGDGTVIPSIAAAKCVDAAGNDNAESTTTDSTVTYDSTAPSAPSVVSIATDSGAVNDDEITNDTTITITGTSEANASIEVFKDAVSAGTATADGSGDWTFDYTGTTLADGTYEFTAVATDAAGNDSAASASLTVIIDATAPSAPAFATITNDTGTAGDEITSDATLSFAGTAEANSTVTIYQDAVLVDTSTTDGSGDWTYDYTGTTLAEDTYVFTATATDTAGNVSIASSNFTVTVDTTGPTVTVEEGSTQDDPATTLPVLFDITFSEPVTGFATNDITMGGTATSPVYAVTGSGAAYTLTVSDATLGGTLIPSIAGSKCTDIAGNNNDASSSTDNTVSCMTLAGFMELFAAIQAKTDNLPASPAAVGSAMTLTSAYDAAKTAAQAATALSNNTWTDTKAGYIDAKISSRFTTTAIEAPGQISSSYGGGTYTFLDPGTSAGISGGLVQIYSATAYAAGSRTVLASCLTNSDGSWGPVNVLPGSGNLTVVISKTGEVTQVKSITVSE